MQKMVFRSGKGLPLRLVGAPETIADSRQKIEHLVGKRVGLSGVGDFPSLRPAMQVQVGDKVRRGQPLWVDKNNHALIGTAPASGKVEAIHRGHKRALLSVEIRPDNSGAEVAFQPVAARGKSAVNQFRERLITAGLWSSFRERPYDRVPAADSVPEAILVTASDSRPLAVDPRMLILRHDQAFVEGLQMLLQLTDGPVLVSSQAGGELPIGNSSRLVHICVSGPYPAGLAGNILHHFFPPDLQRKVWYIDWQDLLHCADLIHRGELPSKRYVALGGGFSRPRVVSLPPGADLSAVAADELAPPPPEGRWRLISGSPLFGHRAEGATAWLGRYHNQVCALPEGGDAIFMNWMRPGLRRYSRMPVFASGWLGTAKFRLNTLRNGGERGLIPVEVYEDALPLQTPVVPLLKALLVGDTERAQELGCLELGAEDLAVCTFVCPSKYDYGAALRLSLDRIEREG